MESKYRVYKYFWSHYDEYKNAGTMQEIRDI